MMMMTTTTKRKKTLSRRLTKAVTRHPDGRGCGAEESPPVVDAEGADTYREVVVESVATREW